MIRQAMLAAAVAVALAGCTAAQAAQPVRLQSSASAAPEQTLGQEPVQAAQQPATKESSDTPWEYSVKNPGARDYAKAVVACLHRKGVKYVELDDKPSGDRVTFSFGGPNNDPDSISRGLDLTPQCEREVSAARPGTAPTASTARAPQRATDQTPEQVLASKRAADARTSVSARPATSQELTDQPVTGSGSAPSHEQSDTPWEYSVKNPRSRDYVAAVVACLRRKGVKYVELDDKPSGDRVTFSLGGPNNDPSSITRGLDLAPQCEREALKVVH